MILGDKPLISEVVLSQYWKDFFMECNSYSFTSTEKIVLTVASSGVASLLLPNGRTAHSRFKISCDLDDTPTYNIKRGTMLAELIQSTSLVIWDEALMTHRVAFEALDRTFRDLLAPHSSEADEITFGGKVVVLGGDARQILPVIEGGTCSQIIDAAICNSHLWHFVTILHLTQNMRLYCNNLSPNTRNEISTFSRWLLDIGEGKVPAKAKDNDIECSWIKIPNDILLFPTENNLACIIQSTYPDLEHMYIDIEYLKK
jgi:hypothetical protein